MVKVAIHGLGLGGLLLACLLAPAQGQQPGPVIATSCDALMMQGHPSVSWSEPPAGKWDVKASKVWMQYEEHSVGPQKHFLPSDPGASFGQNSFGVGLDRTSGRVRLSFVSHLDMAVNLLARFSDGQVYAIRLPKQASCFHDRPAAEAAHYLASIETSEASD